MTAAAHAPPAAGRRFAILPAAGRSRRMGRPKLLLPVGGVPLLNRVLDAWLDAGLTGVVVVVHPEDEPLARLVERSAAELVVPAIPPPDMKASLAHGVQYLAKRFSPGAGDVWLTAPADMPRLTAAVIRRVLAAWRPGESRVLVPVCRGRRGHPIVLPWRLAAEVPRLAADEGLNALVARHGVYEVPLDNDAILSDLDTPDDYRALGEQDLAGENEP